MCAAMEGGRSAIRPSEASGDCANEPPGIKLKFRGKPSRKTMGIRKIADKRFFENQKYSLSMGSSIHGKVPSHAWHATFPLLGMAHGHGRSIPCRNPAHRWRVWIPHLAIALDRTIPTAQPILAHPLRQAREGRNSHLGIDCPKRASEWPKLLARRTTGRQEWSSFAGAVHCRGEPQRSPANQLPSQRSIPRTHR